MIYISSAQKQNKKNKKSHVLGSMYIFMWFMRPPFLYPFFWVFGSPPLKKTIIGGTDIYAHAVNAPTFSPIHLFFVPPPL